MLFIIFDVLIRLHQSDEKVKMLEVDKESILAANNKVDKLSSLMWNSTELTCLVLLLGDL